MVFGLSWTALALTVAGGYLLGSIPFGVLITRAAGAGDLRQIGSGNIGATNVLRTGRKDLALATLLGDGGKGAVAVLVARAVVGWSAPESVTLGAVAGGAAFLGHLFPVWLRFKGGKGVATFFGILLAAAWPVGLLAGATWIAVFAATRISSLSALVAAALAPICVLLLERFVPEPRPILALAIFTGVLIYLRHKDNIGRLLKGEEPKFGSGKPRAPNGAA
jgi:glycerol-3-phosphate acyltransferase PlsY